MNHGSVPSCLQYSRHDTIRYINRHVAYEIVRSSNLTRENTNVVIMLLYAYLFCVIAPIIVSSSPFLQPSRLFRMSVFACARLSLMFQRPILYIIKVAKQSPLLPYQAKRTSQQNMLKAGEEETATVRGRRSWEGRR